MKVTKLEHSALTSTLLLTLAHGEYIEVSDEILADPVAHIVGVFESPLMDLMSQAIGFPDKAEIEASYAETNDWVTLYELAIPDNVVRLSDVAR